MTTSAESSALLSLALEIAIDAGQVLRGHVQSILEVDLKTSATDPVTQADRASESLIARRVHERRPDDGFVGEENTGDRRGTSGLRWVVDPLDATVNFTYGNPHWCVSIAVEDDAGAICGVIHDPMRGEAFTAVRGQGAHLDDRALAVTDVGELGQTMVATGFAYDPAVRAAQGPLVADMLAHVRDMRRTGSAALDLAYVAAGRFDAYWEFDLKPWDWAAGRLLVTEAGGVVTPARAVLAGRELDGLVAGGPAAHANLAAWLEGQT